ncbi:energy transducer TonB [Wenyingzhuangia sp. IMCC45533]
MKLKKNPNANLEKYSSVFTLLGLVLSLFITYQFIEHKSYASTKTTFNESFKVTEKENIETVRYTIIEEQPKKIEAPITVDQPVEEPKDKPTEITDPNNVKKEENDLIIKESPLGATDNEPLEVIDEGSIKHTSDIEDKNEENIPFISVENIPVFPGCEKYKYDKTKSKKCFSSKISKFFTKKFDASIASDLNLTGIQSIYSQFIIGSNGYITEDITTRSARPELSKQVEKILMKLPKMEPAQQNGKPVNIIYTLPVKFLVE